MSRINVTDMKARGDEINPRDLWERFAQQAGWGFGIHGFALRGPSLALMLPIEVILLVILCLDIGS